jgi:hypothetical protein
MDTRLLKGRLRDRRGPAGLGALALASISGLVFVAFAASAFATALAPPENTTAPTITGTPAVGQTLTAQNGTWTNNPTAFQYRWRRCDANGAACVNIAGTGGAAKTYSVVGADGGHTLRVVVTAVNADGARNALSAPTAVVQSPGAPDNTARPTITGTAEEGQTLTANDGTWTGNPTSFAYQWQQCDSDGSNCVNLAGATGKTHVATAADVGFRLRVQVTATNDKGKGTALSGVTAIVEPKTAITNTRPTLRILSVRFLGNTVYARFRICDNRPSNLTIIETDSRPGKLSFTRRFSTIIPPRPCGVYTRHWLPAPRFRGPGRYTVTLRARDKSGLTSLPARRTFSR